MKQIRILFIVFLLTTISMTFWLSIPTYAQNSSNVTHGIGLFGGYENNTLSPDKDFELGDLDNDGDIDIVNMFRVSLNDGQAIFTTLENFNSNYSSRHIALGDIDNDNDLDAIITLSASNSGQIWLNDGNGNFALDTKQKLGNGGDDVVVADLNGDNHLDIFVEGEQRSKPLVWLNDGTGLFTPLTQPIYIVGLDSDGIALGDLDGDDDLDVFISASSNDGSRVLLNDGTGIYSPTNQVLDDGIF
ncbi:MAG: VCBS repeat-containing protein, partial [Anaerolineales bacterium]|nr:VCBS repeat-containing protein [Anaerolineales bacterium]